MLTFYIYICYTIIALLCYNFSKRKDDRKMAKVNEIINALNGIDDVRTKRYINPKRIVYTQGTALRSEYLLTDCPNQINFHPQTSFWMENKPGRPKAGVLIDFGVEFSGSLRLLVHGVRSHERNKATLRVRLGESVMEALTPYGEKNTTNDHANRDMIMNISGMSANETSASSS